MNYLLKIVQGANAGAEIALADGIVTFGSSDSCDIVLADSSLAAEAFAIETTDTGVSLKELPDGEAKKIDLYTLFSFGNSSFAVGENGAAWPELKSPEPPPPPEQPAADTETGGSDSTPPSSSDTPPSTDGEPRPGTEEPRPTEGKRSSRRSCLGCLLVLLLLLVFFAIGYFLALRYGRVWESVPFVRAELDTSAAEKDTPAAESEPPADTLAAWAATNGVAVSEKDGETVLYGNFAKRADRLNFAQDAYERDANLILDLSDDETLKAGVEEVLFVITEGRTKLEVATNRVVKLAGRARSRDELLQTVATICTDVNRVRVVDDTAVVCDDGKRTDAPTRYQALSSQAARKHPFVTPAPKPGMPEPKCPVAGVILMPYPCLVLRDGSRAAEGSMVGEFKVEKIEADKVTLKRGEETVTWKP
ncbi:MAG: hypothetical protein IJQ00_05545 [Kiritimatiellae bacterium]|nr:hypothetical protein [Kiritimatiellia bacterium]